MKYVLYGIAGIVLVILLAGIYRFNFTNDDMYVEGPDGTIMSYDGVTMHDNNQDLIVIAAPSVHNEYYKDVFQDIIDFDVAYANAVMGNDEIRILVDEDTKAYFKDRVPEEILVEASVEDIWMRDFTTVNPHAPVQFRYTPASFNNDQREADLVQTSFNAFLDAHDIQVPKTEYFIDGGNIVDNYQGRIITTTRFLEDNDLSYDEGVAALKELLGAREVAILPPDDEVLAHSDGMVMFADTDTIIVNQYDEPFRTEVHKELEQAFPGVTIVEIEAAFEDEQWDENIGSACGINVNATVTTNNIYMPHFGDSVSDTALEVIQANTSKKVIPVPAQNVCRMGGSVRCLSWQQSGEQARDVIEKM